MDERERRKELEEKLLQPSPIWLLSREISKAMREACAGVPGALDRALELSHRREEMERAPLKAIFDKVKKR